VTVNGEPPLHESEPSLHGEVAVAAAEALAREQQRAGALANAIGSLLVAAVVVVPMMLFGAPTWAWVGFGVLAYLVVL
jgi:hypothetical protein